MQIFLYTFNKKVNSTKRPTGGAAFDVTLKDGCNIINPTLVFAGISNPTAYNYAYIPDFDRYYYVTNWEAFRDRWFVSLAVDVLGSYRDQIGASRQFIARSESEYNEDIPDSILHQVNSFERATIDLSLWYTSRSYASGWYVLGVSNPDPSTNGTTYYVMQSEALDWVREHLFGNSLADVLRNSIWNPGDFIVSCNWFPVEPPHGENRVLVFNIGAQGWLPTFNTSDNINIYKLASGVRVFTGSRVDNIPEHPQAAGRGAYLNAAPYSDYTLTFPPFGSVSIDPSTIYNNRSIATDVIVDFISGTGYLMVNAGGKFYQMLTATISVPVPLTERSVGGPSSIGNIVSYAAGQMSAGAAPIASGASAAAAGAGATTALATVGAETTALATTTGAGVAAGVGASALLGPLAVLGVLAAAGVGAAMSAANPSNITAGSGSIVPYNITPFVTCAFTRVSSEFEEMGRPLLEYRTIGNIPGFVQLVSPLFEIPMTEGEMRALIGITTAGFFYE